MVAAIISSLIFGIYHGNWIQAPYAMIIGLVCVFVYEKYKSIAAPIVFHMSANLFSVLISELLKQVSDTSELSQDIPEIQMFVSYFIFAVITGSLALGIGLIINRVVKPKEVVS